MVSRSIGPPVPAAPLLLGPSAVCIIMTIALRCDIQLNENHNVTNPDHFEVIPVSWEGPAARLPSGGKLPDAPAPEGDVPLSVLARGLRGVAGRRTSPNALSLPQGSAKKAFKGFSPAALRDLANEYGLAVAGLDVLDIVKVLVLYFWPDLDAADLAEILEERRENFSGLEEMLDTPECRDAMGKDDAKLLDRYKEDKKKEGGGKYSQRLDDFIDGAAKQAYEKKPVKSNNAAYKRQVATARVRMPGITSAGRLSEEDGALYLPPGGKCVKSNADNRWRVSWSAYSRSRSRVLYGEVAAFAISAKHVWDGFVKAGGFACPFDFINTAVDT